MTWNASTVAAPSTVAGYDLNIGGTEKYVGNVLTYEWTGLPAVATNVMVRAVTSDGRKSAWSAAVPVTPTVPYNNAAGGTIREWTRVSDGTHWRSHEFTASAPITFSAVDQPVTFLAVSGGQGGGYSHPADARGNGANGNARVWTTTMPNAGAFNVTVGGGGGGGQQVHQDGAGGGASGIANIGDSNGPGAGSVTTDIRLGTNETWAGNGYGGGGAACYLCPGGTGQQGICVIAYQIG
jgi:hypothetical protein